MFFSMKKWKHGPNMKPVFWAQNRGTAGGDTTVRHLPLSCVFVPRKRASCLDRVLSLLGAEITEKCSVSVKHVVMLACDGVHAASQSKTTPLPSPSVPCLLASPPRGSRVASSLACLIHLPCSQARPKASVIGSYASPYGSCYERGPGQCEL